MAKAKKPTKAKRPEKYEEKTPIKQDFLSVMKAAAFHANDKSTKKKELVIVFNDITVV